MQQQQQQRKRQVGDLAYFSKPEDLPRPLQNFQSFMAGYFSNHSQSRFLANSGSSTGAAPAPAPAPTVAVSPSLTRPRAPSSKHFSTSVSTSGDEKPHRKDTVSANGTTNGTSGVHPLRNTYVRTLVCITADCILTDVFLDQLDFLVSSTTKSR